MYASAMPPTTDLVATSRDTLAVGSRSFSLASRLLSARQRDDAAVVYALCRLVDDVADKGGEHAERDLIRLDDELMGGRKPRPLVRGFRRVAQRTGMELAWMSQLIAVCRTDLDRVRVADDAALVRYGYGVAGTVGLMMCAVTEVRDPSAHPFAIDLGVAMQITNICRDVAEDAAMGRVYLPATRLQGVGVDPEQLVRDEAPAEAIAEVVLGLLELAERYYDSAMEGIHHVPMPARLALLSAARVYRQIGRKLIRHGGDALAGRTIVSLPEKLGQVAIALGLALTPRVRGRRPRPHDAQLHEPLRGLPGAHG